MKTRHFLCLLSLFALALPQMPAPFAQSTGSYSLPPAPSSTPSPSASSRPSAPQGPVDEAVPFVRPSSPPARETAPDPAQSINPAPTNGPNARPSDEQRSSEEAAVVASTNAAARSANTQNSVDGRANRNPASSQGAQQVNGGASADNPSGNDNSIDTAASRNIADANPSSAQVDGHAGPDAALAGMEAGLGSQESDSSQYYTVMIVFGISITILVMYPFYRRSLRRLEEEEEAEAEAEKEEEAEEEEEAEAEDKQDQVEEQQQDVIEKSVATEEAGEAKISTRKSKSNKKSRAAGGASPPVTDGGASTAQGAPIDEEQSPKNISETPSAPPSKPKPKSKPTPSPTPASPAAPSAASPAASPAAPSTASPSASINETTGEEYPEILVMAKPKFGLSTIDANQPNGSSENSPPSSSSAATGDPAQTGTSEAHTPNSKPAAEHTNANEDENIAENDAENIVVKPTAQPPIEEDNPTNLDQPLFLEVQPQTLTRSMMNVTLKMKIGLRNQSGKVMNRLTIAGDLISAHGSQPMQDQIANPESVLPPLAKVAKIAKGKSHEEILEITMPLAAITPIVQSGAPLMVPLLRLRIQASKLDPLAVTLVIGTLQEEGQQKLLPFRLDETAQTYRNIAMRLAG